MAWCPKCKAEYVDGVEFCADCNIKLVASPDEASEEPQEDEARAQETVQDAPREASAEKSSARMSAAYVGSAERASDNRSSAYTLLVIGTIGLIAVVLMAAGVLPFLAGLATRFLTIGVMGVLFALFIAMGIVSFNNSRKYARKAAFEEELSANMQKWCRQNLSGEALDAMLSEEDCGLPEEMLYFQRMKILRAKVMEQYMNLDEGFLEHFLEEIYAEIFEA